jgi:hypothetical protein
MQKLHQICEKHMLFAFLKAFEDHLKIRGVTHNKDAQKFGEIRNIATYCGIFGGNLPKMSILLPFLA